MDSEGESRRFSGVEIKRSTELHFDLDDEKIEAIKSCLEKGRLSIRFSNVDLSQSVGRLGDPYLYD
ncbi:MAG TPA: hypothetical protein VIT65_25950 [Microlunatus sp.]